MAIDTNKLQQQAADLSSQLWAIANDLRGGMDANEFRNYILGTIFYRYLSERTEMYMAELLENDGLTYEQTFSENGRDPGNGSGPCSRRCICRICDGRCL